MKTPVLAFFALVIAVLIGIGAWQQMAGEKKTSSSNAASSSGHPALFDTRSFDDAQSAAASENKIFLIKFTAEWCGPCKRMDATTFVDKGVEAWVGKNAIAAVVDVDHQRDLAQKFRIEAMPTMVAMRGGKEIARVVGGLGPSEFLGWAKGLESK